MHMDEGSCQEMQAISFRPAAWLNQPLWALTVGPPTAACPGAQLQGSSRRCTAGGKEGRTSGHCREATQGSRREEFNCLVLLADGFWKWQRHIYDLRWQTDPTFVMTCNVLSSGCICCARFKKSLTLEFLPYLLRCRQVAWERWQLIFCSGSCAPLFYESCDYSCVS